MLFNNKDIIKVSLVLGKLYDDISKLNNEWEKVRNKYISIKGNTKLYHEFKEFLKRNRVIDIVIRNAKDLEDKMLGSLIDDLELIKSEIRSNVDNDKLSLFSKMIQNEDTIFIKGSALSLLYPNKYVRYQVDVDVILKEIDCLWETLSLVKNDYTFDRLKIYCAEKDKMSASLDLFPIEKNNPFVDIHISPFEIWGGINLDIDLWETKNLTEYGYYVPSYENMLIMLIAHLATQWMYRIRDINDCYLLISKCNLDWEYITNICKRHNLLNLLEVVIKQVENVYALKDVLSNKEVKLNLVQDIFMKENLGKQRRHTSIFLEFSYVYGYYSQKQPLLVALKESMFITKNFLLYNNRAYKVNKKLKIKQIKNNEILVLIPFNGVCYPGKKRQLYNSKLYIVNEGEKTEYFISPYGNWTQSTYHGATNKK